MTVHPYVVIPLVLAAMAIPASANEAQWAFSDKDGFVTASSAAQEGLAVACGAGMLSVTFSVSKADLPSTLTNSTPVDLQLLTDAGNKISSEAARRDAVGWWRYSVTGAAAVGIATTIYGAKATEISLGGQVVDRVDIDAGRTQLFAVLNACKVQVAAPAEGEPTVIPEGKWVSPTAVTILPLPLPGPAKQWC
jgi:hypothetical protein